MRHISVGGSVGNVPARWGNLAPGIRYRDSNVVGRANVALERAYKLVVCATRDNREHLTIGNPDLEP
jgi:hypothetical protein